MTAGIFQGPQGQSPASSLEALPLCARLLSATAPTGPVARPDDRAGQQGPGHASLRAAAMQRARRGHHSPSPSMWPRLHPLAAGLPSRQSDFPTRLIGNDCVGRRNNIAPRAISLDQKLDAFVAPGSSRIRGGTRSKCHGHSYRKTGRVRFCDRHQHDFAQQSDRLSGQARHPDQARGPRLSFTRPIATQPSRAARS
ncbi:hypothetical protein FIU90_03580 [Erythrobacter sp. THAF29]|nr:hypothetical protein FIU90_03580 [Erythrobacter sp. THAF29]